MIRKNRVGGSHDVGVGVATITVVKGMLYDVILSIVQLKIIKKPTNAVGILSSVLVFRLCGMGERNLWWAGKAARVVGIHAGHMSQFWPTPFSFQPDCYVEDRKSLCI